MGKKPNTAETNRRNLIKSEARQSRVVRLYFQGMRVHQIAKRMEVSDSTVLRDIERVREEWKANAGRTYDELLPEKLAEIQEVKAAAWTGWRKSLEDDVEVTEESSDAHGSRTKQRRRGSSGDSSYLRTLTRLIATECQLRGMLDQKPAQEIVIPVVEVVVTNREEKNQFETLTTEQFRRLTEKSE